MPNEDTLLEFLWTLSALRAEQPVRKLETQAVFFTSSIIPWFRHGYLIVFPPGGVNGTPAASVLYGFTAYGPKGHFAYQEILDVPGGTNSPDQLGGQIHGNDSGWFP